MKNKPRELFKRPGYRYLVIGGSVYVLELLIIIVAQGMGANAVEAIGLSFWMGLVVSFILQKLVTFGDKHVHHKVLVAQIIAFSMLVLFNFAFTIMVAHLLRHVIPAVLSRTLALGTTTIWNFYLYKTQIFKNSQGILG